MAARSEAAGNELERTGVEQWSLSEWVRTLFRYLPLELLVHSDREAILSATCHLPAALADCVGFEIPLGQGPAGADFAVQITTPAARRALAQFEPSVDLASTDLHMRAWGQVHQFARQWLVPGSSFAETISTVWLEFDVVTPSTHHLMPAFFAGTSAGRDPAATTAIMLEALATAAGQPIPDMSRETVESCLTLASPIASTFQVGTMMSRRALPTRLCVAGLRPADISDYLTAIGAARDALLLRRVAHALPDWIAVAVDIDIIDGSLGRIALECSLPDNQQLAGNPEPRWDELLSNLIRLRACTSRQQAALDRWAGVSSANLSHRLPHGRLYRGISHIKISDDTSGRIAAKAYLGAIPDVLTLLLADRRDFRTGNDSQTGPSPNRTDSPTSCTSRG
ncbi:MAG: hypothetical protein ACRDRS_12535 [Pseudonocardiaceae bacterium]